RLPCSAVLAVGVAAAGAIAFGAGAADHGAVLDKEIIGHATLQKPPLEGPPPMPGRRPPLHAKSTDEPRGEGNARRFRKTPETRHCRQRRRHAWVELPDGWPAVATSGAASDRHRFRRPGHLLRSPNGHSPID